MRVVDRVHGNTTNGRANAAPTLGTSFTQGTQAVLGVGNLTQGRTAISQDLTHLAGAQTQSDIGTFTSHQLGGSTSGANQLSAFTRLQFDTMNGRTNRDIAQRQAVTRLDRSSSTGDQLIASAHAFRRGDGTTLTAG